MFICSIYFRWSKTSSVTVLTPMLCILRCLLVSSELLVLTQLVNSCACSGKQIDCKEDSANIWEMAELSRSLILSPALPI